MGAFANLQSQRNFWFRKANACLFNSRSSDQSLKGARRLAAQLEPSVGLVRLPTNNQEQDQAPTPNPLLHPLHQFPDPPDHFVDVGPLQDQRRGKRNDVARRAHQQPGVEAFVE